MGPAAAQCPKCNHSNAGGTASCALCSSPLPAEQTLILTSPGLERKSDVPGAFVNLPPSSILARRYEILELLGQGGMGAVYKARDMELDRLVALKLIRPELSHHPKMLERFKQEIILARQITHKNVVRIFDLGTHEDVKFLTMEYIEGTDLANILEKRRLEPAESVRIVRQICAALEAAHGENVIHRDLKPQNVMIDPSGRACVMDFGLARSVQMSDLTQTGAMIGTPAYMSPEQARGGNIDARSDIYSVGMMLYAMLTGGLPFSEQTVIASLIKRTQELPKAPAEVDASIPARLSSIVMKCLAIDPDQRYATASALAAELDDWLGVPGRSATVVEAPAAAPSARPASWRNRGIAAAAILAVLAAAGIFMRDRWPGSSPAVQRQPVTVLIADVRNDTGEPVFDGTLEPMLRIALEGASFISAYDRTKLRDLGAQPSASGLDEQSARKIAVAQGLGMVISAALERRGSGYALSATAIQPVTGNVLARAEDQPSDKDKVLSGVTRVAAALRESLGDAVTDAERRFAAETLSATSLDAVHEYAVGVNALSTGKFEEALRSFAKAAEVDKSFGLAYAGMGVAARNLGRLQEAEGYAKQATAQLHRMTERERYRIRGFYYALVGDQRKCIEEYSGLLAKYSADVAARNNLAYCLTQVRDMPRAVAEMRQAVAILPKRALYRNNLALYYGYAGDFAAAEKEAMGVREIAPKFPLGFVSLAFAQTGRGDVAGAAGTYKALEAVGPSLAASGSGDIAVYEGRYADAVRIFEQGAAADLEAKNPDAAAVKFAAAAYAQLMRGQKGPAAATAARALASSHEPALQLLAGRVLAAAGDAAKAKAIAAELASGLQLNRQVYAKLIEGEIALADGDSKKAVTLFSSANGLIDTWFGRFGLGRAYLQAGAFTEADAEFDRCQQRRGEALSLLLDEEPTSGYFPPIYYYQGRVHEGLGSPGYADAYRTYLQIRGKAGEDALLADARRRAGN